MAGLRSEGMNDQAGKVHNAASRFILNFEAFYGREGRRGLSATYRMAQMEGVHLLIHRDGMGMI